MFIILSTGFKAQEARNISTKIDSEKPARIAFLLTVNGRASRQVKRLLSVLYDPSHFYYIHVDAVSKPIYINYKIKEVYFTCFVSFIQQRQDYMYREMLEIEKSCRYGNIKVAKGPGLRHASIWGGASLLTTLLSSARKMLEYSKNWDFLVNLSESDFPIKSNKQLVEFLTINKGFNFVKSYGREVQRFISKQGLDKSFVECEARMWRLGDRKLPQGIQIDGGSDWIALNRNFIEYVSNSKPDELVSGLLKVFKYTLLPAESFFHTVLRNSIYCDTYIDNNLHVTNWKRKLGCKCQYKAIVDWCGCSPNDFKISDINKIRNTIDKNLFFARKFEPIIDQKIINYIEDYLYPNKFNNINISISKNNYWQSLYHHGDLSPPVDDVLLTITNSLVRLIYSKYFHSNNSHYNVKLLEASVFFSDNKYQGVLILAEASNKNVESSTIDNNANYYPERLEALVLSPRNFSTSKLWSNRILNLHVSTDYDQKEQTFRNFLSCVGPLSSPILSYEFDLSFVTPKNLTIFWIDTNNNLRDVNQIQVDETTLIGSIKPQLDEPLTIGKWNIFILADNVLVGQVSFFVTPLSYLNNHKINIKKIRDIHNGPIKRKQLTNNNNQKWINFLKTIGINLNENYDNNSNNNIEERTGIELNNWIDEFVKKYYKIDKICIANEIINNNVFKKLNLDKCTQTNWSSLSPDPKADINNICYT